MLRYLVLLVWLTDRAIGQETTFQLPSTPPSIQTQQLQIPLAQAQAPAQPSNIYSTEVGQVNKLHISFSNNKLSNFKTIHLRVYGY